MILDRRRFLTALGLTGAALGLPPRAWAGDQAPPKRLVIVSTGHGTPYQHWRMRPAGMGDEGAWEAPLAPLTADDFSRSLRPLHPYRSRLQMLDGLSLASAELDLPGYRHEKGWLHAWTGAWVHFTGADLFSTAPSLDQLVARQIARPDRLPSIDVSLDGGRPIVHGGKAQPLPLEERPARVWDRLFAVERPTEGSVLDYALAEHAALRPSLSAADRSRLDTHFALVRQLEERLRGLATASCEAPERPRSLDAYDQRFDAFVELTAAAFGCDLTRVVTMSLGDLPSDDFGWGHYLSGDAHNDFAHRIYEDPKAAEAMSDYSAHHAGQLARLIAALEAVPEGGGSLMDSTLIVWGSELADGWHSLEKYCVTLAGGSWAWPTGRYRHWPWQQTPIPMVGYGGEVRAGIPHQHLLVEVARAMGLDVDHVGLREVTAPDGSRIALTGGLP